MAYEKGDLYIEEDSEYDARGPRWKPAKPTLRLPHSCDEWVIGSPEEAKQLIADLQELIPELEKKYNG